MFNMGFMEMLVLGVVALLVIGPKQLPEVARVVGRMLNEFKRASGDLTSSLHGFKSEAEKYMDQSSEYMQNQKNDFEGRFQSLKESKEQNDHLAEGGQPDDEKLNGDALNSSEEDPRDEQS